MQNFRRLALLSNKAFLGASLLLSFAAAAHGNIIYQVNVNTAAIAGTSGYIDIQFNPGGGSTQAATITASSFISVGGALTGSASNTGDVSGGLGSTLVINNSGGFNDYFQPYNFGSSFALRLQFSGPAINAPNGTSTSGSSFGLSLYAADGATPLLTTEPNGFAATASVNLNGTVTTATYPSTANGGAPVVTFSSVSAVPEPATFGMFGAAFLVTGLALGGRAMRRRFPRLQLLPIARLPLVRLPIIRPSAT